MLKNKNKYFKKQINCTKYNKIHIKKKVILNNKIIKNYFK